MNAARRATVLLLAADPAAATQFDFEAERDDLAAQLESNSFRRVRACFVGLVMAVTYAAIVTAHFVS